MCFAILEKHTNYIIIVWLHSSPTMQTVNSTVCLYFHHPEGAPQFLDFGYVSLAKFVVLFLVFLCSLSRPLSLHLLLCFFWCHFFFCFVVIIVLFLVLLHVFFYLCFFGACPPFIPFCWFRCFVFLYFARRHFIASGGGNFSINYSVVFFAHVLRVFFFRCFLAFVGGGKGMGRREVARGLPDGRALGLPEGSTCLASLCQNLAGCFRLETIPS